MYIPKTTLHHLIHSNVPNVPPPKPENAKAVLRQLMSLEKRGLISNEDSLAKRLEVLIILFEHTEPSTANALRAQLNVARKFELELS